MICPAAGCVTDVTKLLEETMHHVILAAAAVFILSVPVSAKQLSGPEMRDFVTGGKVMLETGFGDFPLRYDPAGQVTGDGSALGLARFFSPRETGRWWVEENRLCQKWPSWYRGRTFCFSIELTGNNSFRWIRDDGDSGQGRLVR